MKSRIVSFICRGASIFLAALICFFIVVLPFPWYVIIFWGLLFVLYFYVTDELNVETDKNTGISVSYFSNIVYKDETISWKQINKLYIDARRDIGSKHVRYMRIYFLNKNGEKEKKGLIGRLIQNK
jgi:hypothetical protein